jgi:hypothetical protein
MLDIINFNKFSLDFNNSILIEAKYLLLSLGAIKASNLRSKNKCLNYD